MSVDKQLVADFIRLTRDVREAKGMVDDLKEELRPVQEALLEQMSETGLQNFSSDGMTVYVRRTLWAGYGPDLDADAAPEQKAEAKAALVAALAEDPEYSWLVETTFNTQRLSSVVRELEQDDAGMPVLPENLAPVLKVTEKFDLGARKR